MGLFPGGDLCAAHRGAVTQGVAQQARAALEEARRRGKWLAGRSEVAWAQGRADPGEDPPSPAWDLRFTVQARRELGGRPPVAVNVPVGALILALLLFPMNNVYKVWQYLSGATLFTFCWACGRWPRPLLVALLLWLTSLYPYADWCWYLKCLLLFYALQCAVLAHDGGHVLGAYLGGSPLVGVTLGQGPVLAARSLRGVLWEERWLGLSGQTAFLRRGPVAARVAIRLAGPAVNAVLGLSWFLPEPELTSWSKSLWVNLDPWHLWAVANLAIGLVSLPGDLLEAVQEARDGNLPEPAVAWERGLWHLERGHLREAEELFAQVPGEEALTARARCLEQGARGEDLLSLDPPHLKGTFRAWALFLTDGEMAEAEAACRAEFEEAPEDPLRRRVRGAVLRDPELLRCEEGSWLDRVQSLALLAWLEGSQDMLRRARRMSPHHPLLHWVEERWKAARN